MRKQATYDQAIVAREWVIGSDAAGIDRRKALPAFGVANVRLLTELRARPRDAALFGEDSGKRFVGTHENGDFISDAAVPEPQQRAQAMSASIRTSGPGS